MGGSKGPASRRRAARDLPATPLSPGTRFERRAAKSVRVLSLQDLVEFDQLPGEGGHLGGGEARRLTEVLAVERVRAQLPRRRLSTQAVKSQDQRSETL